MAKRKTGLHKEISAIFDGVPIQESNGDQQLPYEPEPAPAPDQTTTTYTPPEPPAQESPAPSHQEGPPPPEAPEPQQPVQSPPKAAPTKQPKIGAIKKTAREIPWQKVWEWIKDKLLTPKPGVNPTRQIATVILVPVLFIILIFAFVRALSTPSRKTAKAPSFTPTGAVAGANNKIDWQIPAPYPTTLRDPMQFGFVTTATQAGASGLTIKGIVYSEERPAAIIGTQIVRQGEKVLGATIVKINRDSIEFEMNGKTWTQGVQR